MTCLWTRLWLKEILLFWSSIQTTNFLYINTFTVSVIRLFLSLIIHVFTEVALLISLKNFSFAFTTWVNVWCKRPDFRPVSAFNMTSSLSLIVPTFDVKRHTCSYSFHLNTAEAIIGLFTGLFQYCCVSGHREAWGERERDRGIDRGGAVRTQTNILVKLTGIYRHCSRHPQRITKDNWSHQRSP